MAKYLLALDPGSAKIGVCVVDYAKNEQEKTIVKVTELLDYLREIFEHYQIKEIIIGSGTGSEELKKKINKNFPAYKILLVDEEFSTEEAQARYLEEKPMSNYEKLLRKFISWKVKKPLDDYAALIIAEKYLAKLDKNKKLL